MEVATGGYSATNRPLIILDLDLHELDNSGGRLLRYDELTFGPWTISIEGPDAFELAGLAATFDTAQAVPCPTTGVAAKQTLGVRSTH